MDPIAENRPDMSPYIRRATGTQEETTEEYAF